MNISKTPKALALIAILALAGVLAIAGCGGSGGTTTVATEVAPTAEETAEETAAVEAEKEAAEEKATVEKEAGEETPAEEESAEEAAEEEAAPAEEEKEAGGESALVAEGKTVFTTNCGTCHTLAEAGTSGTVGPNLDELMPNLETVEHQVINGGGPMPAFGNSGILKPNEIKAVATYVSSVAGTE